MNSNPAPPPAPGPRTHRKCILVVEDEFLIRTLISDELRAEEYDVIEAISADEAIAILKAGVRIDLIFTDVRMPGDIDGLGLLAYVKQSHPYIPVVMTSGHLPAEMALSDGAALFLPKPYTFPRALALIQEVLAMPL